MKTPTILYGILSPIFTLMFFMALTLSFTPIVRPLRATDESSGTQVFAGIGVNWNMVLIDGAISVILASLLAYGVAMLVSQGIAVFKRRNGYPQ